MPKSETELKYDIRKHVRLIQYEPGTLTFAARPDMPVTLLRRLTKFLPEATNRPWHVEAIEDEDGEPTLIEAQKQAQKYQQALEQNHPAVLKAKELFPGVEIEFQDIMPTSNVIKADFNKDEDPT